MATAKYTWMRGETRIYDGTPTTPNYLKIPWIQGDMTGPLNRPRPLWDLQLNRDQFDQYAHFLAQSDASLAEPVQISFTIHFDNQLFDDVRAALSNPMHLAAWSVGNSVFADAMGTGASIYNGVGALFRPPTMAHDPWHKRVHFEWLCYGSPVGTRDVLFRHEECFVPPDQIVLTLAHPCTARVTYWVYGDMSVRTAFSSGTDLTPALI